MFDHQVHLTAPKNKRATHEGVRHCGTAIWIREAIESIGHVTEERIVRTKRAFKKRGKKEKRRRRLVLEERDLIGDALHVDFDTIFLFTPMHV